MIIDFQLKGRINFHPSFYTARYKTEDISNISKTERIIVSTSENQIQQNQQKTLELYLVILFCPLSYFFP